MSKTKSSDGRMTTIQLEYCRNITQKIFDLPISAPFRQPVNENDEGCKDYKKLIQIPMDLSKILERLNEGFYTSPEKWKEDMDRIWKNAIKFNGKEAPLSIVAEELQKLFRRKSDSIPRTEYELWTLKAKKKHAKIAKILAFKPPGITEEFVPAQFTSQAHQNQSEEEE